MEKKTKRNVFKVKSRIARAKRSAINKATLELRPIKRNYDGEALCCVCAAVLVTQRENQLQRVTLFIYLHKSI